jgi:hypothetical protein
MSKVLIITDQHFGVRNDSQFFVTLYKKFYGEVVLPYIDKHGITDVLCLGDTFDKRKSINFASLEAAHEMWFLPLAERGVRMTMLVGNHDIYYKNTLKVNAPSLLLREYGNIDIIDEPSEVIIGGRRMLLLPWMSADNKDECLKMIKKTKAKVCMGHLELNGFQPLPGHTMETGDDPELFSKFSLVGSGHFHMKSQNSNIDIHVTDTEEILLIQLRVSLIEVLGETRKLPFHQFLNASIFSDIQIRFGNACITPLLFRGEESVTNLMTHQHGIYTVRCILPDGKGQDTSVHIKGRSAALLVLYNQIFGCEQSCQGAFDFFEHWISSVTHTV